MTTWNHRILRDRYGNHFFAEVFYDADSGQPCGYSNPFMCGDNMGDMHMLVARLAEALDRPVLDAPDFIPMGFEDAPVIDAALINTWSN